MSTEASNPAAPEPPVAADKGKGKAKEVPEDVVMDDEEDDDDDDDDEDEEMDEDDEEEDEEKEVEGLDPSVILPPGARRSRARVDYTSEEAKKKAEIKDDEDEDEDDFVANTSKED